MFNGCLMGSNYVEIDTSGNCLSYSASFFYDFNDNINFI